MRKLTSGEINVIVSCNPKAKKIAVENFLATMGDDKFDAMSNLGYDAKSYKWNTATVRAIAQGIKMACK